MSIRDSSIMTVLAVDDLDRAEAFYRDKLGLEVRRLTQDPTSAVVHVQAGDSRLLLYKSTYPRGQNTVASFLVKDVEDTVSDLRSRGVTFEEYDMPGLKTTNGIAVIGDLHSAWFKDSEGNTIAISTESSEVMRKAA
jgi:catechol 2,3-dioxygenase-like lactoylglutathione lyase family enzyme